MSEDNKSIGNVVDGDSNDNNKNIKVDDPGRLEGVKKDPRKEQNNLTEEHPRFQEVYKNMKKFEVALSEKDEVIKTAAAHNKALMDKIESIANKAIDKIDSKNTENIEDKIQEKIKQLKAQKKEAQKVFDFDKADDIDDVIFDLREQLKEGKLSKRDKGNSEEIPSDTVEAVSAFREKYSWYDEDPIAQAAMNSVDVMYVKSGKWDNKPISERLEAAAQVVMKRLGLNESINNDESTINNGDKNNSSILTYNSVEGRNMVNKNKNKQIVLTDEQKKVADNFNISYEDYVKQLQYMGGN